MTKKVGKAAKIAKKMSAASEINGFNCKMEDEDIFYSDEEFSDSEDSEMRATSEVNGYHTTPSEDPTSKTVYFQFFSNSEITEEEGLSLIHI